MKNISLKILLLVAFCGVTTLQYSCQKTPKEQIVLSDKIQPLAEDNIFRDNAYFNWCNSIIRGNDGKYHMFYARWNREKSFDAWLTHSTVAHAISDSPTGPYTYVNTVIDFEQDNYKAGSMITAHNPKIKYFNGKYHLYFISTHLNHDITNDSLLKIGRIGWHMKDNDRRYLREKQRTYVAECDDLNGKWEINPKSLLEPTGPITTLVVNPAITQGPDNCYYMIVKGDKPGTTKFERNQAVAVSDYPDRDFVLQPKPVIKDWDTEDVSMWYDDNSQRFYAVFHAHKYIGMMTSTDGINWEKAKDFTITKKCLARAESQDSIRPVRMERPFVYVEGNEPKVLSMAVMVKGGDTYIVMVPLKEK